MKNTMLKWIAGLAVVVSLPVSAVPITDTVIIGSQEWAQVNLFTGVSWNYLNGQCPAGVCSATSQINGWDLDGWTWASVDTVQDLFNSFTGSEANAPSVLIEAGSSWAPAFVEVFHPTRIDFTGESVLGWSATLNLSGRAFQPFIMHDCTVACANYAYTATTKAKSILDVAVGAWMVRAAPNAAVPAPATLALFGLGLASLWITRRKRGAKV